MLLLGSRYLHRVEASIARQKPCWMCWREEFRSAFAVHQSLLACCRGGNMTGIVRNLAQVTAMIK